MKLTKNRLKEIILEELMKMQEEELTLDITLDEPEQPLTEQDENSLDILKGKQ